MSYKRTSVRSLSDVFGDAQEPTREMLSSLAQAGGERMREVAAARTPVGATGRTRASWRTKAVTVGRQDGYVVYLSGCETNSHVARWLDSGTAEHLQQGSVQSFTDGGSPVTVRSVEHPGQQPLYLVSTAAAFAEAEFSRIAAPIIHKWALEVEGR